MPDRNERVGRRWQKRHHVFLDVGIGPPGLGRLGGARRLNSNVTRSDIVVAAEVEVVCRGVQESLLDDQ